MFRALSRTLAAGGFGPAAVFDLHPDALLALQEAAWERERLRRDLPQQGLANPEPRLRGFGAVETATGRFLGEEALLAAAKLALAGLGPSPTLAWAWLAEGAGVVELLSALVHAQLQGQALLQSGPGLRWLRATEAIFGGSNPLTLRSAARAAPAEQRAALYARAFGAPVQPEGVVLHEDGFTALLGQALGGSGEALDALRAQADGPPALGPEVFAAAQLVSWFHLSLALDDSPVVVELGLGALDLGGRVAALASRLGTAAAPKAAGLLAAADALDALLRGRGGLEPLATLWPTLEGAPAEDPHTGAGDHLHLAFAEGFGLASGALSFGGDLEPSALTVTDGDARIRTDPPALALTPERFPLGAQVWARAVRTQGGLWYVKAQVTGGPERWTKLSNLRVNPGDLVGAVAATDSAQTGPFAAWSRGVYTGLIDLWLVGGTSSSGLVLLSEPTLAAFVDMHAAAAQEGVTLTINSGFRSYPEQKALYDLYKAGRGNLAARPGTSNHQSGIAIDISVQMGRGNPSSNVTTWTAPYRWLVRRGRDFGFMRTVESEAWHWEYRPTEAANHDAFGSWTALKKAGG